MAIDHFNNSTQKEQKGLSDRSQTRLGDDEVGLTEVSAPSPVDRKEVEQSSQETEAYHNPNIHDARKGEDDEYYLSEVSAPAPVDEEAVHEDEQNGAPTLHAEEKQHQQLPKPTHLKHPPLLTEIYITSYLILFSIFGTLARLGIEALTTYANTPWTSPVLWANLGGSLIMGFLSEDRHLFRAEWGDTSSDSYSFNPSHLSSSDLDTHSQIGAKHTKVKKTIPLFIGLTTGFCGSFTSFSTFMRDSFLALSNDLPIDTTRIHRSFGSNVLSLLALLLIHPTVSLAALQVGAHLALFLAPRLPTLPAKVTHKLLSPLAILLALAFWLTVILLPSLRPKYHLPTLLSLTFAPIGCLLRHHLSKHLNSRIPHFPLGTFTVNIFGTVILAIAFDAQHTGVRSSTCCAVLDGVMDGFCGCCTTVSTWVLEVNTLAKSKGRGRGRREAYFYGMVSVFVGLASLVVLVGSLRWRNGGDKWKLGSCGNP